MQTLSVHEHRLQLNPDKISPKDDINTVKLKLENAIESYKRFFVGVTGRRSEDWKERKFVNGRPVDNEYKHKYTSISVKFLEPRGSKSFEQNFEPVSSSNKYKLSDIYDE